MSKELLTPDKNKIIKLNAPDGEVSFNEDELLMIIQVCHNQLDRNIDLYKKWRIWNGNYMSKYIRYFFYYLNILKEN